MMKISLLIIALFYCAPIVAASYSMVASEIGASAKTIGRGYIEGFDQRAHSVFENPAILGSVNNGSIDVFSATLMNEITYRNIALAAPTPIGTLGVGFMEAISYEIPYTIEIGGRFAVEDWFDWRDSIYKLSFQSDVLDSLSLGASYVRYKRYFYSISADGWDIDLGAFYKLNWIQVSFIGRNVLGHSVTHIDAKDATYSVAEKLPFQGIAAVKLSGADFHAMAQVKRVSSVTLAFFGIAYEPPFLPSITLRAGFRNVLVKAIIKNSVTAGFGVDFWGFNFDVAYEKSDYMDFDHKIYVSFGLAY